MTCQTSNHISLRLDSKKVTEQQKLDTAITEHCTWVTSWLYFNAMTLQMQQDEDTKKHVMLIGETRFKFSTGFLS